MFHIVYVEARGQVVGVSSVIRGGSNSGSLAWWQVPLTADHLSVS